MASGLPLPPLELIKHKMNAKFQSLEQQGLWLRGDVYMFVSVLSI